MKCEKYLNMIDDFVEGELDEPIAGQVNLHVFACSECASRYEALKQEKEMYAHYLFDVEPPMDLWMKFQAKIESEADKFSRAAKISVGVSGWKSNILGFLRLYPVIASAVLFIIFGIGFGLLKFMPDETIAENEYTAKTEFSDVQPAKVESAEVDKDETINLSIKAKSNKNTASPKTNKNNDGNKFSTKKNIAQTDIKPSAVKAAKIEKQNIPANEKEALTDFARLTEEERMQRLQLRNLEKETAKQIEKIELLLRSFRNARSVEGSEVFDVAYEKEQARKLLEKNVHLRQSAENYGTLYTEELLSKVEPLLLDIANLENNSSPEKVLNIKERVKNQNIIASLQIY